MAGGEWDVEVTVKPMTDEQYRQLRHQEWVVARITKLAEQIVLATRMGKGIRFRDFSVIVQDDPDTERPRAFAIPTTSYAIHLELTQSLLLKSVASMAGQ